MILTLPDEPALESFDESELRLELAVALFSSGRISRSVAASIAGMDRFAFDEELFRRRVPSFTAEILEQDLAGMYEGPGIAATNESVRQRLRKSSAGSRA